MDVQEAVAGAGGLVKPVLDACCGGKMFWFDKQDDRAVFMDKRKETVMAPRPFHICPDIVGDFTAIPFPDSNFSLVVFDPPHIQRKEAKGNLTKQYGCLNGDWREMIRKGFAECFRVLKPLGTLIFKWAETEVPISEVLGLTEARPLFGHKSGKAATTHWIAFIKE